MGVVKYWVGGISSPFITSFERCGRGSICPFGCGVQYVWVPLLGVVKDVVSGQHGHCVSDMWDTQVPVVWANGTWWTTPCKLLQAWVVFHPMVHQLREIVVFLVRYKCLSWTQFWLLNHIVKATPTLWKFKVFDTHAIKPCFAKEHDWHGYSIVNCKALGLWSTSSSFYLACEDNWMLEPKVNAFLAFESNSIFNFWTKPIKIGPQNPRNLSNLVRSCLTGHFAKQVVIFCLHCLRHTALGFVKDSWAFLVDSERRQLTKIYTRKLLSSLHFPWPVWKHKSAPMSSPDPYVGLTPIVMI